MSYGITNTVEGTERLAYRLVWAFARILAATRPIDTKVTEAEFAGMCKAANAFGYGNTEHHVDMVVREVMRNRPIPTYNAMNAKPRIAWEQSSTEALTAALDAIR